MTTRGFESSFVRAMVPPAVLERLSQGKGARQTPTPRPPPRGDSLCAVAPLRRVALALWDALSRHGERVGRATARRT